MRKPKILFAAFEAEPFMKTGGLGDVAGSLPRALAEAGANVRVILPKFGGIPEKFTSRMKHVVDFYMDLSWRHQYCGIETLRHRGVTFYFIDNEYYFRRERAYGYFDDAERIAFFSKAILEAIKYLPDFKPQILHCNDWHTAMTPVYLRTRYGYQEGFENLKTVFTVHNLKFQGIYPRIITGDVLGLGDHEAEYCGIVYDDTVNFMRGALSCSDRLTTVSPTYADEVCTDFFGERAQDIFRSRRNVLSGILNGIDTKKFDPETDKALYENFSAENWASGKRENKLRLQEKLGLRVDPDIPLAILISRLTDQKGLDLVTHIAEELLQEEVQLAVLGVGEQRYEDSFRYFAGKYPDKAAAMILFDEPLSHKLYAAADLALVPSLFEPCGLTQMIAMRYGTLPVVRETGGLRDSVIPYDRNTGAGNGFSFANYNAHELLFTIKNAITLYREDRAAWNHLTENALAQDFSWSSSAEKYMALYQELLQDKR